MKLTTKYDLDVPIGFAWQELTDFEGWERMAIRRGAEVQRTDQMPQPGPGMGWALSFDFRNKLRKIALVVSTLQPTHALGIGAHSDLADATVAISLLDLTPQRTRIEVRTEIKPRSLAARIYVQGLKLARKKVERSYSQRVGQLALEIEERHRRTRAKPLR